MPKRNIHFIWRQRGQNEEDEIIRKQNSFQKEKPYTTLEFRIPKDRWEWENNTSDFFERYPDKENDHQLHPLRKQYLENRLKDIDYQERQQAAQDDFTTRMYGKKDYAEERNKIMEELMQGKQSITPGYKHPDEKFWDMTDSQSAKEQYPQTPEAVGKEINRFKREQPNEYGKYIKQIQDDNKTWEQINKDIIDGKITPQELSDTQWQTMLDTNAQDLEKAKKERNSYCNYYARERLLQQGIYMPPGQNANQIKDHMDNHPQNWEKIPRKTDKEGNPTEHLDHQAAHNAAANGDTVIVAYKNPNPAAHGHIAVVNGEQEMQTSGKDYWNTEVPQIDGYHSYGTDKGIKTESLSQQFTKDKESDMDYYRYIGEKKEPQLPGHDNKNKSKEK